jgi:hypothetical protein
VLQTYALEAKAMTRVIPIFFLIWSMNSLGASWNKLSLEELRSVNVEELSAKDTKKFTKAKKKAVKRCVKKNAKSEKKHAKAERNRLYDVKRQPKIKTYLNTKIVKGEFDSTSKIRGGRLPFDYELELGTGDSYFSFIIMKNDVFLRNSGKANGVLETLSDGVLEALSGGSHQLYFWIEHHSKEWFLIGQATLAGGTQKYVTKIVSDMNDCNERCDFEEHFAFRLDNEELKSWYESGEDLRVRLKGATTNNGFTATIPFAIVYGYVIGANDRLSIISPEIVETERSKIAGYLKKSNFKPLDCSA